VEMRDCSVNIERRRMRPERRGCSNTLDDGSVQAMLAANSIRGRNELHSAIV